MKKFESIIEVLSKEDAQQKRYDTDGQKLIKINDRTGEVISGFFSALRSTVSYYLVSNSNLIGKALYTSPKRIIEDRNGRKMELKIECEVSCPPGNESKVAEALHSVGRPPTIKLDRFIERCINKFRTDDEHFIDNFSPSNIDRQIEDFIINQYEEAVNDKPLHITGLEFHTVKCIWDGDVGGTIPISLKDLKVGFNDSTERHSITLDCTLAVENEINARLRSITNADPQEFVKRAVEEIFDKFVAEDEIYDDLGKVGNTIKTHLDERLQKYGRKVSAIKLRDWDLERLKLLQNIEIEIEKRKFLASDRKEIEPKILLTAKITDLRALKRYKDNPPWLRGKLKEKAEIAISEFINEIDSGEFYSNIELNKTFQARLIQTIGAKVGQIINAQIGFTKIDIGRFSIQPVWTPFEAQIKSQIEGRCYVKGSFIITGDEPRKYALREPQQFNNEDVKNKIIETLEAWLVRFSTSVIISTNLKEPDNFEKAIKKLLLDKVAEAYGVVIEIQNIKTELPSAIDIGGAKDDIDKEIIKAITEGWSNQRIAELKQRKLYLGEFEEERRKSLGQSDNSSDNSVTTPGSERINPLLKEVNQLLLEETTSSKS